MLDVSRLVQNEREIIIIIACFIFLFDETDIHTHNYDKNESWTSFFSFLLIYWHIKRDSYLVSQFFFLLFLLLLAPDWLSSIDIDLYPWSIVFHVRVVAEVYVHRNFIPKKNVRYQENVLLNNFIFKNKFRTVIPRKSKFFNPIGMYSMMSFENFYTHTFDKLSY